MRKKIVFIMNPISGSGNKKGIPEAIDKYINTELFDYEIRTTEYAGHACHIATEAKEQGVDVVVAVGGDGTVNEVARAIVESNTALGIIPCGSGNGLARHLMLPMNVKKCLQVINKCEIHSLDYGKINEHCFFCTCGMGFDAFVSKKFAQAGKRGPITYAENILREGLNYQPETYEIEDETGVHRYKAFLISCANASQYGNNAYIAPRASMSDGLLDVIIMEPFDLLDAPQISLDMFNKTLDKNSKIHRKNEGVIHFDGDPVEEGKDIVVSLKEKGIKVIVNPDADKSLREPNAFQSIAASLFNDLNDMRRILNKRSQKLGKVIQRKLTR